MLPPSFTDSTWLWAHLNYWHACMMTVQSPMTLRKMARQQKAEQGSIKLPWEPFLTPEHGAENCFQGSCNFPTASQPLSRGETPPVSYHSPSIIYPGSADCITMCTTVPRPLPPLGRGYTMWRPIVGWSNKRSNHRTAVKVEKKASWTVSIAVRKLCI